MAAVPFLSHCGSDEVVAFRGRRTVRVSEFLCDVRRVAESLPVRSHLVNFCDDRYRFVVGLGAALVRGQVSLLPPTQTPEMLVQMQQAYPGLYALGVAKRFGAARGATVLPGRCARRPGGYSRRAGAGHYTGASARAACRFGRTARARVDRLRHRTLVTGNGGAGRGAFWGAASRGVR